jgi:hypothetical protein
MTTVYNLATDEQQVYSCDPINALISAAMLDRRLGSGLSIPGDRDKMKNRITYGKKTATIGDWEVRI